jgi:enoyl-CoA hydratase/carnithine racemase
MGLLFEVRDGVAVITINRPEALNALDPETQGELAAAWRRLREDAGIRAAIVTGAGDRAFSTGADLKKTMPPPEKFVETYFDEPAAVPMRDIPVWKPVLAAVNGYAIGGGLELALACDLRVCSDNATFGLGEVRVGTIPGAGGTQRLTRALPAAVAMKLLLTGDRLSAEEALRWGLVSDVVLLPELLPLAERLAQQIARNAPLAVRAIKMAAVRGHNLTLDQGLEVERLLWGLLRDTEDRIEGRRAFAEKRPPAWKGR